MSEILRSFEGLNELETTSQDSSSVVFYDIILVFI
jgi:hypothetical protein